MLLIKTNKSFSECSVNTDALTLAIQAGGESRRMGSDKAFILLEGKPLFEHVLKHLAVLDLDETIVITRTPNQYAHFEVRAFVDLIPNCGPLGGLLTALSVAKHDYIAVIACDMPFANALIFRRLFAAMSATDYLYAAMPIWHEKPEPLHAIYHRRALQHVKQQLEIRELQMNKLLKQLDRIYLDEADYRDCDPSGTALMSPHFENYARVTYAHLDAYQYR